MWPWRRKRTEAQAEAAGTEPVAASTAGTLLSEQGAAASGAGDSAAKDPYAPPALPDEAPACAGGPIADVADVAALYDTEEELRLFIVFEGTVQGVGFRWTTQSLAERAGVTGWVRNMDDGTVEAEMQGTGHAICQVLWGLRGQFIDAWANYEILRRMQLHFSIKSCERRACRNCDGGKFRVVC